MAQIDGAALGAQGKAMQGLAATVGKVGEQFVADQHDADEYEVQKRFVDFDLAQEQAFEDAKRDAPENPRDFTGNLRKGYDEAARGFFSSVPDRLKPKFDELLVRRGAQFERRARGWESEARDAYHANDLSTRLVDLNNLTATQPDSYQENIARGVTLIDTAPLPAAAKMKLRTKFAGEAEAYAIRARIEKGEGLDTIVRDLGGGPEPLDTDENPELRARPFSGVAAGPAQAEEFHIPDAERRRLPAGMRNNNPGNIKYTSRRAFAGVTGPSENTDQGDPQAVFETPQQGMDAAADLARRKYQGGKTTAMELIAGRMGWTPGNEAAARNVARSMGISPDADLELDKPENMAGFLKALTLQEHGAASKLYPDALYQKAAGAKVSEAPEAGPAYTGPYRHLTADQRLDLMRSARARIHTAMEGQREQLKQSLDDDVESIRRTGQSATPDLDTAKRVLEPNQVNRYLLNRQEAEMEFGAMRDLHSLPEAELQRRLDEIEPKPGEALFEMKAKVFDKVSRAVNGENGLRNLREHDPARAVDDLPEVQQATQATRDNPDDPGALQALARARLDAQAKVHVPEGLRSPITKAEAKVITAPLKGLEGKALTEALIGWHEGLQRRYGPYARTTALHAIDYAITRDKDLAEIAESQINTVFRGQQPSAALARRADFFAELNAATRAFGGEYVGEPRRQYGSAAFRPNAEPSTPKVTGLAGSPDAGSPAQETPFQTYGLTPEQMAAQRPVIPQRAIDALKANPALASEFDARYGAGAAEPIINPQGKE